MPLFEFTRSGAMQVVAVDGTELSFNGNTATRTLAAGESSVQWFARGNDGDVFALTVGRPASEPVRDIKGTLGPSRKDAGVFWLEV